MSEPSSPEAAAEALARLYTANPDPVAIRLTAAAIRERDRAVRREGFDAGVAANEACRLARRDAR
jgi:hypothetical protein